MKRLLLVAALLGASIAPSAAQVNPTAGVISGYAPKQTYSAVWIGLVPAGTTPTDIVCIAGSSTKTITVQNIKLSGSGTAISLPVTVLRRVTLDTGGTAATTTANPANTISRRVTTNGAPTATLVSYTANPTINDTSPTYIDSAQMGVVATTVGVVDAPLIFDWAKDIENLNQGPVMRNGQTTQQICINLNSTTSVLLLTGSITWTEE